MVPIDLTSQTPAIVETTPQRDYDVILCSITLNISNNDLIEATWPESCLFRGSDMCSQGVGATLPCLTCDPEYTMVFYYNTSICTIDENVIHTLAIVTIF